MSDIFLTKTSIKVFIEANLLNAIDLELINVKYEDLTTKIEVVDDRFVINIESKSFKKPVVGKFKVQAETYEEQLRGMMGATMAILNGIAKQCKSIIYKGR